MSTEHEPDAPQPTDAITSEEAASPFDPEDPIDDPRASRGDLVVPILVFILLVLGIGRTVHQGSGNSPEPDADPGGSVVSDIHPAPRR